MSVNISVDKLKPARVGRPCTLSLKDKQQHFPFLCVETGWKYYSVTKATKANEKPEIHCLRASNNESSDYVNDMQWYCPSCSTFPCKWRGRDRHLKNCMNNNNNFAKHTQNNQPIINNFQNPLTPSWSEELLNNFASLTVSDFNKIVELDEQSIADYLALLNLE